MEPKKLLRSTSAQINFLINYMSTHKNFANAIYDAKLGVKSIDEEWTYLRGLLKQHGPDKSIERWKQVHKTPVLQTRKTSFLKTRHNQSFVIQPLHLLPQTWRDIKRKARKEQADISAKSFVKQEKDQNPPVVSESTIKVLDTIGREIPPECKVNIKPMREVKYLAVRRRRRYLAPDPLPKGDLLQVQNQTNTLLQKLCELMAEQNSVLKERNQIERRKLFYRKRRR